MKANGNYEKIAIAKRASALLSQGVAANLSNSFGTFFNKFSVVIAVAYSFICLVDIYWKRSLYYHRHSRTQPMRYGELLCIGILMAAVCGFSSGISLRNFGCVMAIMSSEGLADIYWERSIRYNFKQLMVYRGPPCVGIVAFSAYGCRFHSLAIIAFAMASTAVLFGSVKIFRHSSIRYSRRSQMVCGGLLYFAILVVALYAFS
jgi:hypothetical protein